MTARSSTWVAAIDLGASSVRVCVCDIERTPLSYEVVHRVAHRPARGRDGRLRWNWTLIGSAVLDGLELASTRGLASIGIDTWAVDYGVIDLSGDLLADPVAYRDDRTSRYRALVDRIGERHLYEINGLQCVPFNTIFQLDAEDKDLLARAGHILTLPELIVYELTGEACAETTSAGSTGLVDQSTRDWSDELLAAIGVPRPLFPEIVEPGTLVGDWRGVPVHLVAGHDTASAVVGIGAREPNPYFVSTGTWLLAGQELPRPLLNESARSAQFTNEYGPESTTRFLKNIAGFWILEECRRSWGGESISELLEVARAAGPDGPTFDATDPRFLAPVDMEAEVLDAVALPPATPRATTVSIIIDSLSRTTADVIGQIGIITGQTPEAVHVVGGGVRAASFLERIEHHLDVPIQAGATESAALGNAMIQGIGLGRWAGVSEARGAL